MKEPDGFAFGGSSAQSLPLGASHSIFNASQPVSFAAGIPAS